MVFMLTMNDARDLLLYNSSGHLNRRTLFIGKGKPIKKDM